VADINRNARPTSSEYAPEPVEGPTALSEADPRPVCAGAVARAREMGMLKMGTVALDGTKIHANASRHSALSYEHAGKIEVPKPQWRRIACW
jgi:hypothetical protein